MFIKYWALDPNINVIGVTTLLDRDRRTGSPSSLASQNRDLPGKQT